MSDRHGRRIDDRASNPAPRECPNCGHPTIVRDESGRWFASGPADLAAAAKMGIEGEGWIAWTMERADCESCGWASHTTLGAMLREPGEHT